jgi:hypothetical protein
MRVVWTLPLGMWGWTHEEHAENPVLPHVGDCVHIPVIEGARDAGYGLPAAPAGTEVFDRPYYVKHVDHYPWGAEGDREPFVYIVLRDHPITSPPNRAERPYHPQWPTR